MSCHKFAYAFEEEKGISKTFKVLSSSARYASIVFFAQLIFSTSSLQFVFFMVGPKQNAGSLLTPVSHTIFDAFSHGTLGFALYGSSLNHFLIGGNYSTANQILSCNWLLKLPWRAKPRVPCEKASKIV